MIEILCVVKDIGQAKGIVRLVIGRETRRRYLGHGNDAGLQLLHVFILTAQLTVGENLHLHAAIGLLIDLLRKLRHGNVHGMGLRQAMGQCQHQRIFRAVAAACPRCVCCTAAGHETDAQHRCSPEGCHFSKHHTFLPLPYIPIRSNCSKDTRTL